MPQSDRNDPVRVIVADDQPLILSALAGILDADPEITVVAQVTSGPEAVEAARTHRPDVAVLDVYMPDGDGLDAAEQIVQAGLETRVLMLTTYGDEDVVRRAMEIGVGGFLVKGCKAEELVQAVLSLHGGGAVLSPEVIGTVMAGYAKPRSALSIPGAVAPSDLSTPLTRRERDVLGGVVRALTNAEIAADLVIGETTVKTYISRLIAKLKVRDRVGLAVWALETRYLD